MPGLCSLCSAQAANILSLLPTSVLGVAVWMGVAPFSKHHEKSKLQAHAVLQREGHQETGHRGQGGGDGRTRRKAHSESKGEDCGGG